MIDKNKLADVQALAAKLGQINDRELLIYMSGRADQALSESDKRKEKANETDKEHA